MQNSQEWYVHFTFVNVLFNHRMEYSRLKIEEEWATAIIVTHSSVGNGKYRMSSHNRTAQTAMRLPMPVIEGIKEVTNVEDPEFCLRNDQLNKFGMKTNEELIEVIKCSPFQRFYASHFWKLQLCLCMNGRLIRRMLKEMKFIIWLFIVRQTVLVLVQYNIVCYPICTCERFGNWLQKRTSSHKSVETNGQQKWKLYALICWEALK